MSEAISAAGLLRGQYKGAHDWLEGTLGDITAEQAHKQMGGNTTNIASQYAHVLMGEDALLSMMVMGTPPLLASSHAGKTGISEPPPMGAWHEWAEKVKVDLPLARQYAQAVYANTDAYLAKLTNEDLTRPLDLSMIGMGQQTVAFLLSIMLANCGNHTGEISCLKGMQDLKGYPA